MFSIIEFDCIICCKLERPCAMSKNGSVMKDMMNLNFQEKMHPSLSSVVVNEYTHIYI